VTEQVVRARDAGVLGIGAGGGMSARGVFRDCESGCRDGKMSAEIVCVLDLH
jgi:hypothetical protein